MNVRCVKYLLLERFRRSGQFWHLQAPKRQETEAEKIRPTNQREVYEGPPTNGKIPVTWREAAPKGIFALQTYGHNTSIILLQYGH